MGSPPTTLLVWAIRLNRVRPRQANDRSERGSGNAEWGCRIAVPGGRKALLLTIEPGAGR